MATFLVGAGLAAVIALVVRSMIRDKKNGKSLQCGCSCKNCNSTNCNSKNCSGHCGSHNG